MIPPSVYVLGFMLFINLYATYSWFAEVEEAKIFCEKSIKKLGSWDMWQEWCLAFMGKV